MTSLDAETDSKRIIIIIIIITYSKHNLRNHKLRNDCATQPDALHGQSSSIQDNL